MLTNAQRTEDYRNGSYKRTVMNPEPADNAPQFLKDYYDYYKTKRGYHHLMCNEKISLTFAHMKKDTVQKTIGRIMPFVLLVILIPISLIFSLGTKSLAFIRKIFRR